MSHQSSRFTQPQRPHRLRLVLIVSALMLILAGGFAVGRKFAEIREWWQRRDLPVADDRPAAVDDPVPTNVNGNLNGNTNRTPAQNANTAAVLPAEKNIKVPFTTQAPDANWDATHEQLCEEAAVLMVARYWQGRAIKDAADAESALQQIKQWEIDHLGFFEDTTTEEASRILSEFYGFRNVAVIKNPTMRDIKTEIAAGHPVIAPFAGRDLKNPNYKRPGPLYHMMVLKGYTKSGDIITNDPGTRKGADYVYDPETILNAMHDWNAGDVGSGQRIIIVVRAV